MEILTLHFTPYFGYKRLEKLLKLNIDLKDFIKDPRNFKKDLKLFDKTIDFLRNKKFEKSINQVLNWQNQDNSNQILTILDKHYPQNLKEIEDPPLLLYLKGDKNLLNNNKIAIVGTREASLYGKNVIKNFVKDFVTNDLVIVSGLAKGIDALAHEETLINNGKTIAVLGTGIFEIYPTSNKDLFFKIQQQGLLISEFPLYTKPDRFNFPKRNRIISAISQAILIVESALKSGSLITANYAKAQNKTIFAVPGDIFKESSKGCNDLIKNGAKIANSSLDILNDLALDEIKLTDNFKESSEDKNDFLKNKLTKDEFFVYNMFVKEVINLDEMIQQSNFSYEYLTDILFNLELEGLIYLTAGGFKKHD